MFKIVSQLSFSSLRSVHICLITTRDFKQLNCSSRLDRIGSYDAYRCQGYGWGINPGRSKKSSISNSVIVNIVGIAVWEIYMALTIENKRYHNLRGNIHLFKMRIIYLRIICDKCLVKYCGLKSFYRTRTKSNTQLIWLMVQYRRFSNIELNH